MEDRELPFLVDTEEMIKLCLNCSKRECNNCLGTNCSVKPERSKIDHDKFMSLYNKLYTDTQIAKEFGVGVAVISGYRKKNNIPTKRPKNIFDEAKFMELYEQGLTDIEIARELDMTQSYICVRRNKLGLPAKHATKRRKHNAKGI